MAHQAHHLPWETLASNFKFIVSNRQYGWTTNLFPRYHKDQKKRLGYFVKAFNQTLGDFSTSERAKYSLEYTAPEPDDVVITSATARRIKKTVLPVAYFTDGYAGPRPCEHPPLPLSPEYMRMSFWINAVTHKCSDLEPCCPEHLFYCFAAVELTKTLILYNELETLLSVAAHPMLRQDDPMPGFDAWWQFPEPTSYPIDNGWGEVMRCALMSYICLNVFYIKPETYDNVSKSQKAIESCIDYRSTIAYQKMLVRCTGGRNYDTHTYPHREFFGVVRGRYHFFEWREQLEYGRTSLSKLEHKDYTYTYAPTSRDIPIVEGYLRLKGLPQELVTEVIGFADYKMMRRLVVADDPLHPENALELRKYLNYCWQIMVRVDVMAKVLGRKIKWREEITECIYHLWGEPERPDLPDYSLRTSKMIGYDDDAYRGDDWDGPYLRSTGQYSGSIFI